MTKERFIARIEDYYGPYDREQIKGAVLNYLDIYEESRLSLLSALIIKQHPVRFGTPCVATIEQIHKDYVYGDMRRGIPGHSPYTKVAGKSACAPVEAEPPATEEEVREIISGLEDGAANLLRGFIGERHEKN